jgi:hypothetical protein
MRKSPPDNSLILADSEAGVFGGRRMRWSEDERAPSQASSWRGAGERSELQHARSSLSEEDWSVRGGSESLEEGCAPVGSLESHWMGSLGLDANERADFRR